MCSPSALTPEDRRRAGIRAPGIYRNVWLDITGPVHVAHWGTYVTTPQVTAEQAIGRRERPSPQSRRSPANVTLQTTVLDAAGKAVAPRTRSVQVAAGATQTVAATLDVIARPQRWDIDHPYLYTLVTEVLDGNRM